MTENIRKLALVAHVSVSVGWAGALAVFLAHAAVALVSDDAWVVRAADLAMGMAAWFVILPLCVATLITGLVQGLGTPWGLLQHYWVLAKLLLTVFATVVLLLKLGPIKYLADAGMETAPPGLDLSGLRMSLMVHAAGGLVVLLTAIGLAVYKPSGMTRFGLARLQRNGIATANAGRPPSIFWKRAFWLGVVILIALAVAMIIGGEHGPSAHLPAAK